MGASGGVVVSSATMTTDFLVLEIAMGGNTAENFNWLADEPGDGRLGQLAHPRPGSGAWILNNKGQFVAAELLVPSVAQVRTLTVARSDPYSLPITPLAALGHKGQYAPASEFIFMVW